MPQVIPRDRKELLTALDLIQGQGATLEERRSFITEVKTFRPNVDFSIEQPEVAKEVKEDKTFDVAKGIAGAKEAFTTGAEAALQAPIGAAKGVLGTISGAAELGQKGLRALTPGEPEITKIPERITEPVGGFQKAGQFVERVAEFALPLGGAAGLAKSSPLAIKSLTQAVPAAAITAAQKGEFGSEAIVTGAISGAFPLAAAGFKKVVSSLFGKSKLIQSATGLTKTVSSKADDIAQSNIRVKGQVKKAYEGIDDFLVDEGFFTKGTQTTRADILQQADDLFAATNASKKEVLKGIKTTVPIKRVKDFTLLTQKLQDAYKGLGLTDDFARIKEISGKSKLNAVDLDDLRRFADDLLPRGAFSGAEPVKTKGLEKAIAPLRDLIASLDETGIIQQDNVRKRVLAQLLGLGKTTNPLKLAVEKDPGFNILKDLGIGATGAFTVAAIPGGQAVAPLVAGASIAKAITENPSIAAGLVNTLTKFQGQTISTEVITNILKAASLAAVNDAQD